MPLLPGAVRSQFTFRPISPERAAGGSANENSESNRLDRLSPESDSGRSYSSRSRSESGSRRSEEGSRTPEEDMSRATTPGNTTELGRFLHCSFTNLKFRTQKKISRCFSDPDSVFRPQFPYGQQR
jgi:hypothetical protein